MLHRNKLTTTGEPSTCILHQYRITLLRQDAWVQVTVIPQAWGCSKDFISLPFPVWFQPSFLRCDFLVSGSYWKEMLIMKPHPFSQKQEKTFGQPFVDFLGYLLVDLYSINARRHFSTTNPKTMHFFTGEISQNLPQDVYQVGSSPFKDGPLRWRPGFHKTPQGALAHLGFAPIGRAQQHWRKRTFQTCQSWKERPRFGGKRHPNF